MRAILFGLILIAIPVAIVYIFYTILDFFEIILKNKKE